MIKSIKSTIIFKNVFSFINEYIKLKLVKYIKYAQIKLGIEITNYIYYQGKYIIYESNKKAKNIILKWIIIWREIFKWWKKWKSKEYNDKENLIFEGKYLKGKRNGKGKEYHYGRLIFEGEYLNGEKNGKCKEYNYNSNLIFDGEYLKGKRMSGEIYEYKEGKLP